MVPQAIAKPFSVAGTLVTGRCRYMGFSVIGTVDAANIFTIYDGPEATGRPIDQAALTVFDYSRQWYGPQGILCESGITIGALAAAVSGIIYYVPQTSIEGLVLVDESGSQRVIVDMHNQVDIDALWAKLSEGQ